MTTPDEAQAILPVTQADRDAAVTLIRLIEHRTEYLPEIEDGSYDENFFVQAFARHRISHCLTGDVGTVIEQAARAAMIAAEVARTDVVKPVNGAAPYTVVSYHGQRIEFHDDEWTIEMHRDAGTGKAAAFAQAVNDGLFDLAKRAAAAALTPSALSGDAGEALREQGQREGKAAVCQWLRDLSATIPPGTLHHAAAILADDFEQSELPSHQGAEP